MLWLPLLLLASLLTAYSQDASPTVSAKARQIHESALIVDTHADTPQRFLDENFDIGSTDPKDHGHLSLDKAKAGNLRAEFFSIWVEPETNQGHYARHTLDLIDSVYEQAARHPDRMMMAFSTDDIERAHKQKKLAALMGIEGGHSIENDIHLLRDFYRLGVRYMTLTHWETIDWADAATDSAKHGGLTPFGEEVVREMNRLGMLVDLSHVSDATMVDAIRVSRAPVFFSHSSARALANHVRNVPDSILKMVRANGGVVMVNFNPGFVSEAVRVYEDSMARRARALRASGADSGVVADSLKAWGARAPKATLAQVADHIEHIRDVAGVDAVGLGSDFDGITEVPVGLEDVSKFPDLLAELLRRGWSEQDVKKVAGLNALRVLRAAEQVAAPRKM